MERLRKVPDSAFRGDSKVIEEIARTEFGGDIEAARRHWIEEHSKEQVWINEKYQVATIVTEHEYFGSVMQINIRRRDGNVIMRDWREFQDIKNQLAGPECEAIEIYPAESRLIDVANKYHLWCFLDGRLLPLGWHQGRHVRDDKSKQPGLRQRPFPKHWQTTKG